MILVHIRLLEPIPKPEDDPSSPPVDAAVTTVFLRPLFVLPCTNLIMEFQGNKMPAPKNWAPVSVSLRNPGFTSRGARKQLSHIAPDTGCRCGLRLPSSCQSHKTQCLNPILKNTKRRATREPFPYNVKGTWYLNANLIEVTLPLGEVVGPAVSEVQG